MTLKRGNIVLVPFPFTDLSSSKVRPAVIVSSNPQTEDITIAFISSVVPKVMGNTDFIVNSNHLDFALTGLKKTSVFKMGKLLTIHNTLILRFLGQTSSDIQGKLDILLKKALSLP